MSGATDPPEAWYIDYPLPARKPFTGQRHSAPVQDVIEMIRKEAMDPQDRQLELICTSALHFGNILFKELEEGAPLVGYACVADLDARKPPIHASQQFTDEQPRVYTNDDLKEGIRQRIDSGLTLKDLAECCPAFGKTWRAAKKLLFRLEQSDDKNLKKACAWFTGGKGFRVVWWDELGFYSYQKGDRVSDWVVGHLLPQLIGKELFEEIQSLCDWDKNIYDGGKGVKTDLQTHYKTGFWPFVLLDEQDLPVKREGRDESLCRKVIPQFWKTVLSNIPTLEAVGERFPSGSQRKTSRARFQVHGQQQTGTSKRRVQDSQGMQRKQKRARSKDNPEKGKESPTNAKGIEQRTVLSVLVRVSPSVGSRYQSWAHVFFALFNELGEAAFTAFDEWSRSAESYESLDHIKSVFSSATPRCEAGFSLHSLARWAADNPALKWLDLSEPKDMDASTFLEAVDMEYSGWKLLIRIGSLLFPQAKDLVIEQVHAAFPAIESRNMEKLWGLEKQCDEMYVDALYQYVQLEMQNLSVICQRTLQPTYGMVHIADGYSKGKLKFWSRDTLGEPERILTFDLCSGWVYDASGSQLRNLYPLRDLFRLDVPPIDEGALARRIGEELGGGLRIKWDSKVDCWRFYDEKRLIWRPCGSDDGGRCTDEVSIFLQQAVGLVHPMYFAMQALEKLELTTGKEQMGSERSAGKRRMAMIIGRQLCHFLQHRLQTQHHAQGLLNRLKSRFQSDFISQRPELIATPSGVVNLKDGKIYDGCCKGLALTDEQWVQTPYEPHLHTRIITDLFRECMFPPDVYSEADETVRALQMFMGYRLTGETSVQQAWFLWGVGGNMKSLVSRWLFDTLGSNFVATLSSSDLSVRSSKNNDAVFRSMRKRVWNINESNSSTCWDEEQFKSLTGSESEMGVSAKYKPEASFRPIGKLMAFVNSLPTFSNDDTYAVQRRCVCLHLRICYPGTAEQRESLLSQGICEDYLRECNPRFYEERLLPLRTSFLAWMVEGAKLFYAQWRIPVPQSVQKEGISRQGDISELVRDFAVSSLRSREDFRLPLQWLYEVFLLDHQGEVQRADVTSKRFNRLCCKEVLSKFQGSSKSGRVRWSDGLGNSYVSACLMGVFWSIEKENELEEKYRFVRENNKVLDRFQKP